MNDEEKQFTTKEFDLLNLFGRKSKPCVYKGRIVPGNLGYGIRRRYCNSYRAYQEDPRKDRDEHQQTAVYRNNLGGWVQIKL